MIPLSRPSIGDEERAAVMRVLDSGHLAAGPEVEAFESEFAAYCGVGHAVAVANGTVALQIGLWALGVGPGDEVVVPSFTFAATANAVALVGATPVFADIDPKTYCITAASVERVLSARTAAVMPVHLYGHPAPMGELAALCEARGLVLAEDAAQAHGALWRGRRVGGLGRFAAFSFYPTKNMTTGEGGMVTTDDAELAAKMRLLRNHGMERRYHHDLVGTNARMGDIAAALGRCQLRKLDTWTERRRTNARILGNSIEGELELPHEAADVVHVFHQYTIRTPHRDRLLTTLRDAGVGYGIYYPLPCHRQAPFAAGRTAPLAETDKAANEVISLPVRPDLTTSELGRIARATSEGTRP